VREAFLRNLSTEEADRAMDPALCFGQDDCHKRAVDWRARALAAEEKFGNPLMVICAICGFTGLAANHHHTCPSPPRRSQPPLASTPARTAMPSPARARKATRT
jgi:hypothetical protein